MGRCPDNSKPDCAAGIDDFQIQADKISDSEQKQKILDQSAAPPPPRAHLTCVCPHAAVLKKDLLASLKDLTTELEQDAWMCASPPHATCEPELTRCGAGTPTLPGPLRLLVQ